MSKTLYVFVDESGNFDFSPKGTEYFVMSAVYTTSPEISARAMLALKYKLLGEGIDVASFHATNDFQIVRDQVFEEINNLDNVNAISIYGEKSKFPDFLREPEALLAFFGEKLITKIQKTMADEDFDSITAIFDRSLTEKRLVILLKLIKPSMKYFGKDYLISFHPISADPNSQIADYVSWSKFVSLERGEKRPLESLNRIRNIKFFDIQKLIWGNSGLKTIKA